MPMFSLTKKGNVVQCKSNCKVSHKHFVGKYEDAIKYFGIDESEIRPYGDLINVIAYKQTNGRFPPKLSNELYDICVNLMSEHKYYVQPKYRKDKAFELLGNAQSLGLIFDDLIIKSLKARGRKNDLSRIYMYEKWCNSY